MITATEFLRSLTDSVELLDKRLARVEAGLAKLDSRLRIMKFELEALRVRAGGSRHDTLTPVADAAIDAVDNVFTEAP